jgi:2-furoyl-CoA dehydrogenase large subunit
MIALGRPGMARGTGSSNPPPSSGESTNLRFLSAEPIAPGAKARGPAVGFAAVVEPAISNMGYITTVLNPEERDLAGPKSGAQAAATVSLDPLGGVSVAIDSVSQGQGHRTATAQIVADIFGLTPEAIRVEAAIDTGKDAWSIAAGNYSSRFAGATAGVVHIAATRLRDRLAGIAAAQLSARPEDLVFAGARVFAASNRENSLTFARIAATDHWSPAGSPVPAFRETAFWSPAVLGAPNAADEVNGSAVYGFVFDFCGVEIDRDTGTVCVDKYVSLHDAGRILNPALLEGQVCGGFAMAVGAALYERLVYAEDGDCVTGSLLDYALPTASMIPVLEILHQLTPSPVTPLGAKGVVEGNSMSTPVCIANAVADALGVAEVSVPLTPERVLEMVRRGGQ